MSVQTQISRITAAVGAAYDAVTAKGGTAPQAETVAGLADAIGTIPSGGGSSTPVSPSDITFYDYDGTVVAAWTLAELAGKTALPDLPSHEGLICQGWNWSLADLKTTNRKMNVGAMYITDDGKTRIYIRLEEGRTSPMLGVCPNGTVTVDWGDGTTPDTLIGTSTSTVKWTPNHAYAAPGEYVIKLSVDGAMGFYGSTSTNQGSAIIRNSDGGDNRNYTYRNSVQRVEIGFGVTSIGSNAFCYCYSITKITIPSSVTSIGINAFSGCYSITQITIPNGVTSIGDSAFSGCHSITQITIPSSVTSIGFSAFSSCYSITQITIPNGVTSIRSNAFYYCHSITKITIPNGVTSIGGSAFSNCYSITQITIPSGVTSIGAGTFYNCHGVAFYDFANHTSVPTLSNTNAFTGIAADCEIRVPAALVDEWKAATNWATYADHIVGV